MNISELARKLNISTKELKDILPAVGFDIGEKAIKIDDGLAKKVVADWRNISNIWRELKRKEREEKNAKHSEQTEEIDKDVKIPPVLSVKDFSRRLNMPVTKVIEELMRNGILASMNERIDFDTAAIVAQELGYNVFEDEDSGEAVEDQSNKLKKIIAGENKDELRPRPPVIVVMGHVDHGKTQLLDSIRKTNVVAGEAGGITQHIGAYQVEKKGRLISFIDTPGHEAFTAMRSRGAKIADIAILVVAADDGIKPQTLEAIKIIQQSKIPMIVAINKIDKPDANPEKVKQELAQHDLLPEDWGGKTICVPVSALRSTGIDDLLDMVLLVADMEKDNIVANPSALASGTVIESHIDKGEGVVATVLIQNGTLKTNDCLGINGGLYGKVRAMKDYMGEIVKTAGPSTPVRILGFKIAPQVGDILEIPKNMKCLNKKIRCYPSSDKKENMVCVAVDDDENEDDKAAKLNIILKADVLGSLEAILESLEKIEHEELEISIVSKGLGNITESDIQRAEATDAQIFGFNVNINPSVEDLAREKGVTVKFFKIIYELMDDVRKELEKMLKPEVIRIDLGKMKVLGVFRSEPKAMIIGGSVIDGVLEKGAIAEVLRKGEKMGEGKITQLQQGKQETDKVRAGHEAGMKFEGRVKDSAGRPLIQVNDIIEVYKEESKKRTL